MTAHLGGVGENWGEARRGGAGSGGKARTAVGGVGVAEGDFQHVDAGPLLAAMHAPSAVGVTPPSSS